VLAASRLFGQAVWAEEPGQSEELETFPGDPSTKCGPQDDSF